MPGWGEAMHQFSTDLFLTGRAIVTRSTWVADAKTEQQTIIAVEDLEADYRLALPGTPPQVDHDSVLWAAKSVAWAAGVLVDRDQGETGFPDALQASTPDHTEPSAIYSVDLLMRFLPSLLHRATRIDRDDPLLDSLGSLAIAWPLSSVGCEWVTPDLTSAPLAGIQSHACLRQMYVDRIIAKQDRMRLDQPWVRQAVELAVGDYPELADGLLDAVKE